MSGPGGRAILKEGNSRGFTLLPAPHKGGWGERSPQKTISMRIALNKDMDIHPKTKTCKGERSFVPSALLSMVSNINGDYHPRLCSPQPFRLLLLAPFYALRAEIKEEINCGNRGLSLQKLDHALFPLKISSKISCVSNNYIINVRSGWLFWLRLFLAPKIGALSYLCT